MAFALCSRPSRVPVANVVILHGHDTSAVAAAVTKTGQDFYHVGTNMLYLPGSDIPAAAQYPRRTDKLQRLAYSAETRSMVGLSTVIEAPLDPLKRDASFLAGHLKSSAVASVLVYHPLPKVLQSATSAAHAARALVDFAMSFGGRPSKSKGSVGYLSRKELNAALDAAQKKFSGSPLLAVLRPYVTFALGMKNKHTAGVHLFPRQPYDLVVEGGNSMKAARQVLTMLHSTQPAALNKAFIPHCTVCHEADKLLPCHGCLKRTVGGLYGTNLDETPAEPEAVPVPVLTIAAPVAKPEEKPVEKPVDATAKPAEKPAANGAKDKDALATVNGIIHEIHHDEKSHGTGADAKGLEDASELGNLVLPVILSAALGGPGSEEAVAMLPLVFLTLLGELGAIKGDYHGATAESETAKIGMLLGVLGLMLLLGQAPAPGETASEEELELAALLGELEEGAAPAPPAQPSGGKPKQAELAAVLTKMLRK
eukprot:TRINITY_DN1872_c0_g1_i1.p1 TRINITY_DN1872_c0_g1~~TRINITY_DN1872_c0_g1_i1.p1  ORF type:complete len:493 (-),score=80.12 TRINITY_DN1872_c0_g1_i1:30-1475(-)